MRRRDNSACFGIHTLLLRFPELSFSNSAKRFCDLPVRLLLFEQSPLRTDGCSGIIFAILAYDSQADQAGDNYCYIGNAGELFEHYQDAC